MSTMISFIEIYVIWELSWNQDKGVAQACALMTTFHCGEDEEVPKSKVNVNTDVNVAGNKNNNIECHYWVESWKSSKRTVKWK